MEVGGHRRGVRRFPVTRYIIQNGINENTPANSDRFVRRERPYPSTAHEREGFAVRQYRRDSRPH